MTPPSQLQHRVLRRTRALAVLCCGAMLLCGAAQARSEDVVSRPPKAEPAARRKAEATEAAALPPSKKGTAKAKPKEGKADKAKVDKTKASAKDGKTPGPSQTAARARLMPVYGPVYNPPVQEKRDVVVHAPGPPGATEPPASAPSIAAVVPPSVPTQVVVPTVDTIADTIPTAPPASPPALTVAVPVVALPAQSASPYAGEARSGTIHRTRYETRSDRKFGPPQPHMTIAASTPIVPQGDGLGGFSADDLSNRAASLPVASRKMEALPAPAPTSVPLASAMGDEPRPWRRGAYSPPPSRPLHTALPPSSDPEPDLPSPSHSTSPAPPVYSRADALPSRGGGPTSRRPSSAEDVSYSPPTRYENFSSSSPPPRHSLPAPSAPAPAPAPACNEPVPYGYILPAESSTSTPAPAPARRPAAPVCVDPVPAAATARREPMREAAVHAPEVPAVQIYSTEALGTTEHASSAWRREAPTEPVRPAPAPPAPPASTRVLPATPVSHARSGTARQQPPPLPAPAGSRSTFGPAMPVPSLPEEPDQPVPAHTVTPDTPMPPGSVDLAKFTGSDELWTHIASLPKAPKGNNIEVLSQIVEPGLEAAAEFIRRYPDDVRVWDCRLVQIQLRGLRELTVSDMSEEYWVISLNRNAQESTRARARVLSVATGLQAALADSPGAILGVDDKIATMEASHPAVTKEETQRLRAMQVAAMQRLEPTRYANIFRTLAASRNPQIAAAAKGRLSVAELRTKPLDGSFMLLDGKELHLSELRGKVVLLDFWTTANAKCRDNALDRIGLYNRLRASGLEIVGISVDESRTKLENEVSELGIVYPQVWDAKGWNSPFLLKHSIAEVPTIWLLNRAGIVAFTHTGDMRPEALELRIKKLLME
ncbi:hypothetical protein DB346_17230 [Verrucomicrobia bacterium LW23]|nr:hypothetical protein DB346_17230 [Verrucomicrobia bacterium LW23]